MNITIRHLDALGTVYELRNRWGRLLGIFPEREDAEFHMDAVARFEGDHVGPSSFVPISDPKELAKAAAIIAETTADPKYIPADEEDLGEE